MHEFPPPKPAHIILQFASPFSSLLSSIVRFPPERNGQSYAELACSHEDRENISELISKIGEKSYLGLLTERTSLKQLGAQINHVHPLKFLEVVFTSQRLKACMPLIIQDSLKKSHLIEGLGASLTREADKGKLDSYVADFAKELKVPMEAITPFFQERNWEGLVAYLSKPEEKR